MTFIIVTLALLVALVGCLKWRASVKNISQKDRGYDAMSLAIPAWCAATAGVLLVGYVVFSSVVVVPPGTVYNGVFFGTVQQRPFEQGLNIVNPLLNFTNASVRRQIVEFQAAVKEGSNTDEVISISKDNLPLTVDVTFAYRLNPSWAWWVYKNMGSEDVYRATLITQAARNASRDAVAQFTSDEATTTKREELGREMAELFEDRLVEDMTKQGLSPDDARKVFTILPVQLRKALPPDKVIAAISEKEAAKQDLQRQKTLTSIAEEIANRRAMEGKGVSKLFAELPTGFTPGQISIVLGALANKTRADALLKSVEMGQVKVIVVPDGNPVAVPAQ